MTLRQRLQAWQSAAMHHALDYYGLAVKVTPYILAKNLRIVKTSLIQTWLETPRGNTIKVVYKRQDRFAGKRIELTVNGTRHYFGPRDAMAIRSLLSPL